MDTGAERGGVVNLSEVAPEVCPPRSADDAPAVAHIGSVLPVPRSLCSARIIGIPAGHGARVCSTCLRLRAERLGVRSSTREAG